MPTVTQPAISVSSSYFAIQPGETSSPRIAALATITTMMNHWKRLDSTSALTLSLDWVIG